MDLQTIVIAIARLSSEDFDTLRVRMNEMERERYQSRMNEEDPEVWINDLHAAIAEFREGLTPEEWAETSQAMNSEYVEPPHA